MKNYGDTASLAIEHSGSSPHAFHTTVFDLIRSARCRKCRRREEEDTKDNSILFFFNFLFGRSELHAKTHTQTREREREHRVISKGIILDTTRQRKR